MNDRELAAAIEARAASLPRHSTFEKQALRLAVGALKHLRWYAPALSTWSAPSAGASAPSAPSRVEDRKEERIEDVQ